MQTPAGFPHVDISWLEGSVIVNCGLEKTTGFTKAAGKDARETSAIEVETEKGRWTLFWWEKGASKFAATLSRKMKCLVAYLWDESGAGWTGYSVFENGKETEAFEFGDSMDAEMEMLRAELGEDFPIKKKAGEWDVSAKEKSHEYHFRSKAANASEKEIIKNTKFIDQRFKALGIPVPKKFPPEKKQTVIWVGVK